MNFEVEDFVQRCKQQITASDAGPGILEILKETIAEPDSLRTALQQEDNHQGDMVLYRDEQLTVLHVAIPAGVKSAPHDHGMWACIGIYEGREDNTVYRWVDTTLEQIEHHVLCPGQTLLLEAGAVHDIYMPVQPGVRALHVYGGDLFNVERQVWHPETQQPAPFTQERMQEYSRIARANQ